MIPISLLVAVLTLAGAEAPAPLRFGDVELSTGVRLHYAEQGGPDGPAVILLHGYSDSWFSYSRVLPLLPAGRRVFALDQRGHGDSGRPADGYAMRDLAADVIAFMDATRLERATIVGHSMGSFVAQQVALAAPERVERLVLVGSATTPRNIIGILELERAVEALADPVPVEFIDAFQRSTVFHPVPEEFMERAIAESRKLPARVWQAIMDGLLVTDTPAGLAGRAIPTRIFWGDRDTAFPRSEQDALLALLPEAELLVYAETGHALHWERPAQFARDLTAFVGAGGE
ncbi:MAG: alpha/beta fold hydrolase [Gemmatimonadota bacterium]